jgi:hypothetical protein
MWQGRSKVTAVVTAACAQKRQGHLQPHLGLHLALICKAGPDLKEIL